MKVFLACVFIFLFVKVAVVRCDDSESSSSESKETYDDVETNQILAAQYLKEIMPSLETHLQWALDLHFKDLQKASFIDQIDAKFQTKEIGDYLRKVTEEFKKYKFMEFKDEDLKRQIEVITSNDYYILRSSSREKIEDLIDGAEALATEFNICSYKDPEQCEIDHSLMLRKMLKSKDLDEVTYYWSEWRAKAGKESLDNFKNYIVLYRRAAKAHNFINPSEMYLDDFEDDNIFDKLTEVMEQLKPFYKELHAHVRYLLRSKFGSENVPESEPIPEHLLEKFILEVNLENPEITYPFPESPLSDLGAVMRSQNYTPTKFFEEADQFFTSMKIPTCLNEDWKDYITLKEDEGCSPRAISLFTKVGTGFFYCKEISFKNLLAVHSEMFKVLRDVQTKSLPLPYRVTQTDGFYQGLSDSVQLAVSSPAYLHKIGILPNADPDPEKRINYLYLMALRILLELHREFAMSKYYLQALNSPMPVKLSNCDYWKIQEEYVGVQPPVPRKDKEFDAISMLTDGFVPDYVDRILAKVVSFKLYEGLCKKSGKYEEGSTEKALYNCDFSGSEEAGKAILDLIKLGSSKKWHELITIITEDNKLDATALLKYFEPLREWLQNENKKNNVDVGWSNTEKCTKAT